MLEVFVTLEGNIGDYIKPVRTKSTANSPRLQALQANLNAIVHHYSSEPAEADKCQLLWEGLTKAMVDAQKALTAMEKTWDKFKEIVEWYKAVGKQIATGARRVGVSRRGQEYYLMMFRGSNVSDPEFLTNFLKKTVCETSLDFKSPNCAEYLWDMYNGMSKEELLSEAVRERVSIKRR